MTVTNHMMTGAFIAVAVPRPALAIPLALVSHFALDILPHYGYGDIPREQRDKQNNFILKQTIDTYCALGLIWLVPYLLRNHQTPIVTVVCMLVAFVPDAIWSVHYVLAQRTGKYRELNRFNRFHKAIQWCERSWGIYVEALWFALVVLATVIVTS